MTEAVPPLRYQMTPSFLKLLDTIGCTLAVSVYMPSSLVLVSAADGQAFITPTALDRPMGLAPYQQADGSWTLAVAQYDSVVLFGDAPLLAATTPGHPPGSLAHLFMPRAQFFTGDIDAHEMVFAGEELIAANTRFSCLARIDAANSFTPLWSPPCVSQLMPDDRCHLNGIALTDGKISHVSAFGCFDTARGWDRLKQGSGVVLSVPDGRPVLEGLCIPHSPRVIDGVLHVLESGTGRVLRQDAGGKAEVLAELPGFTRGFDRFGDILFVGLSRCRDRPSAQIPIHESGKELICGVAALERRSGRLLGWLRFDDSYQEVFDVKVLPGIRRAGMVSNRDQGAAGALVLPGRAFWGAPVDRRDAPSVHLPGV